MSEREGSQRERTSTAPGGHRLGPVEEIPVGEGRAYAVAGQQVAVFRLRDGSVRVLSAVCPHAGGPLADGQIDDEVLICPLHLHVFELATGCSRTGQQPVRVYQAEIDDRRHVLVRGLG